MQGVNKVILIGNVGKTPEIRQLQNGNEVANFSIAINEYWKDKDGERKENTQWFNIVIYNKGLVEITKKYISKGSKLSIEGKLNNRKYQDSLGHDKYITEIICSNLTLLDKKDEQ